LLVQQYLGKRLAANDNLQIVVSRFVAVRARDVKILAGNATRNATHIARRRAQTLVQRYNLGARLAAGLLSVESLHQVAKDGVGDRVAAARI